MKIWTCGVVNLLLVCHLMSGADNLEKLAVSLKGLAGEMGTKIVFSEKPEKFVEELLKLNKNAFLYSDLENRFYQLQVSGQKGNTCFAHSFYNCLWLEALLAGGQGDLKKLYEAFIQKGLVEKFVSEGIIEQGFGGVEKINFPLLLDASKKGVLPPSARDLYEHVSYAQFLHLQADGIKKPGIVVTGLSERVQLDEIKTDIKQIEGALIEESVLEQWAREVLVLTVCQLGPWFRFESGTFVLEENPQSLGAALFRFHGSNQAVEGVRLSGWNFGVPHATALVVCKSEEKNWYFYADSLGVKLFDTPGVHFRALFDIVKGLFDKKETMQAALVRALFSVLNTRVSMVEDDPQNGASLFLEAASLIDFGRKKGIFNFLFFKESYLEFFKALGDRLKETFKKVDLFQLGADKDASTVERFKKLTDNSFDI